MPYHTLRDYSLHYFTRRPLARHRQRIVPVEHPFPFGQLILSSPLLEHTHSIFSRPPEQLLGVVQQLLFPVGDLIRVDTKRSASSARVISPSRAATATLALKLDERLLRFPPICCS
jgi:hypothetical protein